MKDRVILFVGTFVLLLASACTGGRHELMLQQLSELERQNVADSVMTNDSLAEALVAYFDRHGTANERLRAHYILGRTYADMGEAPAAINAYLDAADCADTTAADCDFAKLSRVYGQMADVFYRQNLMDDYISACDKAIEFAWIDKDTLQAFRETAMKVAGYNRLMQYDRVIDVFDEVFDQIIEKYGSSFAAQYALMPVNALLEEKEFDKAKFYLDLDESESGYFDSLKNIEKGREIYYYYRGRYMLGMQKYDSAKYYFQKELLYGTDVENQCMASHALSLMYSELGRLDSAAKYAIYSYEMLDSVYTEMATLEVERMAHLHDYTRHLEKANNEHLRANREKTAKERLYLLLTIVIIFIGAVSYYFVRKRRKSIEQYQQKVRELSETARNLQKLKEQKAVFEELANKEITLRKAELASIHQENERLTKQIKETESILAHLRSSFLKQQEDKILTNREVDTILEDSPIYKRLHDKAKSFVALSNSEWQSTEKLVKEVLPGFYNLITSRQSSLRLEGRRLCFLLRMHVGLKEAGALMGLNQPKISKLSKNILLHVFQEDGSGKKLIRRLEDIL